LSFLCRFGVEFFVLLFFVSVVQGLLLIICLGDGVLIWCAVGGKFFGLVLWEVFLICIGVVDEYVGFRVLVG